MNPHYKAHYLRIITFYSCYNQLYVDLRTSWTYVSFVQLFTQVGWVSYLMFHCPVNGSMQFNLDEYWAHHLQTT